MILIFAHIAGRENQKSRKLMIFILEPKPRIFEIKQRNDKISKFFACHTMGDLCSDIYIHISDKQNDMKIYNFVV